MGNRAALKDRLYGAYASLHTGRKPGSMEPYLTAHRDLAWRLRHLLPRDKAARCLDLACGAGECLYFLQKSGFLDVTGVDLSAEQVALSSQVCANVVQASAEDYLAKNSGFDLITMFSIFEHLAPEDGLALLDAAHASLNPGGRLILIMPNADSPFASHMRYGDVTHEVLYNQSSLSTLLGAAGFEGMQAFETGPVPHGVLSGLRWVLWKLLRQALVAYRLIEGGSARGWLFTTEFVICARKVPRVDKLAD